jgi:hypothetical protein
MVSDSVTRSLLVHASPVVRPAALPPSAVGAALPPPDCCHCNPASPMTFTVVSLRRPALFRATSPSTAARRGSLGRTLGSGGHRTEGSAARRRGQRARSYKAPSDIGDGQHPGDDGVQRPAPRSGVKPPPAGRAAEALRSTASTARAEGAVSPIAWRRKEDRRRVAPAGAAGRVQARAPDPVSDEQPVSRHAGRTFLRNVDCVPLLVSILAASAVSATMRSPFSSQISPKQPIRAQGRSASQPNRSGSVQPSAFACSAKPRARKARASSMNCAQRRDGTSPGGWAGSRLFKKPQRSGTFPVVFVTSRFVSASREHAESRRNPQEFPYIP